MGTYFLDGKKGLYTWKIKNNWPFNSRKPMIQIMIHLQHSKRSLEDGENISIKRSLDGKRLCLLETTDYFLIIFYMFLKIRPRVRKFSSSKWGPDPFFETKPLVTL